MMNKLFGTIAIMALVLCVKAEDSTTNSRPMMSRALLHNTVRIETLKSDGGHVGTGFYFEFQDRVRTSSIPVIVTCWHVVSDSSAVRLYFALNASNNFSRVEDHFTLDLPPNLWIRHPDTNIDLAVMPLAPLMRSLKAQGKWLDYAPVSDDLIASSESLREDGVFQEVKFIGYPIGIWDSKNNLPIVRRGMTATDPTIDYNGRTEFLIDAAVFPGSSGSPVYVASEGGGIRGNGLFTGSRLEFLGILYAVHQYTSEGKIEIVTIPTAFDAKVRTQIPANLGLVIKAGQLNSFKTLFDEIVRKQEEMEKTAMQKAATAPEAHKQN